MILKKVADDLKEYRKWGGGEEDGRVQPGWGYL